MSGLPDHAVLWKFNPVAEQDFTFKDFIKLFFHGNVDILMQRSQLAMATSVAGHLDPELVDDDKRRVRYLGDPVKFAMSTQVLRNLPWISAVIPVLIFSLAIASMLKVSLPFIRRWPILVTNFMSDDDNEIGKITTRRKREVMKNQVFVPYHLAKVAEVLTGALDGIEYLTHSYPEDGQPDEIIRYQHKRSVKFAGYNQRKARLQFSQLTNLSKVLRSWLQTWVRILPNIANCLGQLIGCHVQFGYWGSLCKPIVPIASCVSIFGFSLESVSRFSYPF